MKRCPECRRDYTDETLNYCLDDGSALVEGPASGNESQTALLPGIDGPGESAVPRNRYGRQPARNFSQGRWRWIAFASIPVLAIGGFAIFWINSGNKQSASSTGPIQIERLTTSGLSTSAAISPDGKYVIYGVDEGGKDSLWLRQVSTSSNVKIFPAEEDAYYWGLTFTPDSDYVNFVRAEFEKNISWGLNQMPVLGGTQKVLVKGLEGGVSYSPDGKQFAFIRDEFPSDEESSVLIANADGSNERIIATRRSPETFPARQTAPAWSPDGSSIACIIRDETTFGGRHDIVEISLADGKLKPIKTQEWKYIAQLAWLRDKSALLVLGADKASSSYNNQIWRFSYPDGTATRVTTDFNHYVSISLMSDFSSLVTVQNSTISNIWTAPVADLSKASQVRYGGSNDEGFGPGLSLTPDGRIVFYSRASGADDIWIMAADGGSPRQLTSGTGANFQPTVTRDGHYVVFPSERDDQVNIHRMGIDGDRQIQLTSGNNDYEPTTTPDGRWVIYTSETSGRPNLWKVSIDGGDRTQLTQNFARSPEVSPDGRWIVCNFRKDEDSTWRYAILPIEGGDPIRVFDLLGKKSTFRWSTDSRTLYYLRDTRGGVTNLWSIPFEGGEPRQVSDFKAESIFNFVFSPDGKQMVFSRGVSTSDVVLMRGF